MVVISTKIALAKYARDINRIVSGATVDRGGVAAKKAVFTNCLISLTKMVACKQGRFN